MKKLKGRWVVEPYRWTVIGYEIQKKLYDKKSEFQRIEIFESKFFGNIMLLDDCFMLTEKEEFVYHEMIVHVPMFSHSNPKVILVIGGGDGGTVRELLKHQSVQRIDFVEIDEDVFRASLKYFPRLTSWYGNEKVNIQFCDGVEFIKNKKNEYDVIIIDSTDPVGPAANLFSKEFYIHLKDAMKTNGIIVAQTESPFYSSEVLKKSFSNLSDVFREISLYLAYIPTYPSGCWSFTIASDESNHQIKMVRMSASNILSTMDLNYYSFNIHASAFVLPKFVEELIHG